MALPEAEAKSIAFFAQGTYWPIPAIGLTIGARYTSDRKALDSFVQRTSLNPATPGAVLSGFPFVATTARTYHSFTPKFGIDWQITPNAMVYASATKGFKSGGTNYAATNPAFLNYKPESIWAYEIGAKTEWFDRRLRLNVAAFHYDYTDLQVLQPLAPGIVAINNAASATIKGLEFEASAKPWSSLLLTANYSLLDARYDEFPASAVVAGLVPYVASSPRYSPLTRTFNAGGDRMNAAPKSTFSASAQYDHDIGYGSIFVRGEYYWQASASYDPSNAPILVEPSYDLINLSLGYKSDDGRWTLNIQTKNLTDREYLVGRSAAGVVPAGLAGPPRTIILQLSHKW
ncbi:TonB-dependent receptor [Sphingobium sp. EM0848]|uniref:TonB-dependent receptor n=1 Tax=Sphingobium sp. EM0848 TaxID=2743473 RepID=UPI00159C2425|nr:TonB-dependent receptor [Sphingobium sp. EM0848]